LMSKHFETMNDFSIDIGELIFSLSWFFEIAIKRKTKL
jgi:hypothetical protein